MTDRSAEAETRGTTPRVRRGDPALDADKKKDDRESERQLGLPRWTRRLVYAVFWVALVLPWIRRQRRGHSWYRIRLLIALAGAGVAALGWTLSANWLVALSAVPLAFALVVGPVKDPDRERLLQARHGAQSFLNGGTFGGGRLPGAASIDEGAPLYLLVRDSELLLVPRDADDEVLAAIDLGKIAKVLVDGEPYRPVFIPEAKDPPVREVHVDRSRTSKMELVFNDETSIRFVYTGAFSRHLAESTAHALDHARRSANRVAGQSPEVFHIVGR